MRSGVFIFSGRWMPFVQTLPETGMGYKVVSVVLKDGRKFDQVAIDSGCLSRIRSLPDIPFSEDDIADINVTHDKWDWAESVSSE